MFKRVGLRLPFTAFERELLTEINIALAQLHPNSWAFIRAFKILCGYLGILPSVDVFLHFFEVKKQGKSLWVSFSGVAGRILLALFQNSYKRWKGKFFRVCCAKRDPTALDGFPLYWAETLKLLKPKSLDELTSADREVCVALAGPGVVFSTVKLIACEFNADALSEYFGRNIYTPTCLLYICLLMCFLLLLFVLFVCSKFLYVLYVLLAGISSNPLLFRLSGATSVMDSSRRIALAKTLRACPKATFVKAGASSAPITESNLPPSPTPHTAQTPNSPHSLQTPNSPPPIVVVSLAVAANLTPAPLDKGKGVLVVPSDDEGSGEGQVFKRRRTNRVVNSRSASPQRGESLRDNPPSATSPPPQIGQEEGAESIPLPTQTASQAPAPKVLTIPPAIMQLMRGFNEKSPGSSSGEAKKEGMPYYMGAFLAIALDWRAQAKTKAIEMQTLQALK